MDSKMLLLVIISQLVLFSNADSISINVYFYGSTCTLCDVTNFAYCPSGGNVSTTFSDPIPSGYMVNQISITTTAMYWCETDAYLNWYVGETPVGLNMSNEYNCVCGQCPPAVSSSSEYYSNGFPGYMYGSDNTLVLQNMINFASGSVGVAQVAMVIEYSTGGGGNQNASVIVPYDGCGFCDLCGSQSYSLSNGGADCGEGVWDDGYRYFLDPTPEGSTVVQITVVTARAFWCHGPSQANFTVGGSYIGTSDAEDHECICGSCPGPQVIQSKMFQTGFPNYSYGQENYIRVAAVSGDFAIGELELIVTYQESGSKQNIIHTI